MPMKNPIDIIRNRTRDLLACNPVPITSPRAAINKFCEQNAELINIPVCGIYIYLSNLYGYFSSNFKPFLA
jgi:hypothetical protein